MPVCNSAKHCSEIGCNRQVSSVFQIRLCKAFNIVVYFATLHIVTQNKQATCSSMICASGSVLVGCSSKFGHSHYRNIVLVSIQVFPKSTNAVSKVSQVSPQ